MEDIFVYNPDSKPGAVEGSEEIQTAILTAKRWANSSEPIMVRLGKQAQKRLLDGDDPDTVLNDMRASLDAFKLAQEG